MKVNLKTKIKYKGQEYSSVEELPPEARSAYEKAIAADSAAISTKIPDVALGPVATADPLWPPNLIPHALSGHAFAMPTNAGKSIDDLFLGKK